MRCLARWPGCRNQRSGRTDLGDLGGAGRSRAGAAGVPGYRIRRGSVDQRCRRVERRTADPQRRLIKEIARGLHRGGGHQRGVGDSGDRAVSAVCRLAAVAAGVAPMVKVPGRRRRGRRRRQLDGLGGAVGQIEREADLIARIGIGGAEIDRYRRRRTGGARHRRARQRRGDGAQLEAERRGHPASPRPTSWSEPISRGGRARWCRDRPAGARRSPASTRPGRRCRSGCASADATEGVLIAPPENISGRRPGY